MEASGADTGVVVIIFVKASRLGIRLGGIDAKSVIGGWFSISVSNISEKKQFNRQFSLSVSQ